MDSDKLTDKYEQHYNIWSALVNKTTNNLSIIGGIGKNSVRGFHLRIDLKRVSTTLSSVSAALAGRPGKYLV